APQCRGAVRDHRDTAAPGALPRGAHPAVPNTGPGGRPGARTGCSHRGDPRRARPATVGDVTLNFEMGPEAAALRTRLRDLIRREMPAQFPGAFTDDPADLEAAQRFCRVLAEQDLLCLSWPAKFGGAEASVWDQTV